MADVLRRDHSPVMAAGVLLDHHRDKVQAGVLQGDRRAKVRVDVPQGHRRDKVQADVLQGDHRAKARVDVLRDRRRAKVREGVLQANQAGVDDPRDRRPVVAAEEATGVATAVAGKAVEATNNRADNRDLSPVAAGDTVYACSNARAATRNITGSASLAPAPRVWKIRLSDQAPAFTGA